MQIYEKLKSRLDKFLGTLSRYSTILKIIAVDSIWRFKKESFLILITNFLVFFQVWTIGLAIYYAHALEKGNNIKMLGYEFQTKLYRTSFPLWNGGIALPPAFCMVDLFLQNERSHAEAQIRGILLEKSVRIIWLQPEDLGAAR